VKARILPKMLRLQRPKTGSLPFYYEKVDNNTAAQYLTITIFVLLLEFSLLLGFYNASISTALYQPRDRA